jgi:lipid-binding SYLF domain-containing protein
MRIVGLTRGIAAVALLALALVRPGDAVAADTGAEIDAQVDAALVAVKEKYSAAGPLLADAKGVLVFPSIVGGAIIIGGEYGEGALRVDGKTVNYYAAAAGSIGLQLGGQKRTDMILFMNDEVLKKFEGSSGWEAGVDGTINLLDLGASGAITTNTARDPIIGFIFGEKGIMAGVSFKGNKFTKVVR